MFIEPTGKGWRVAKSFTIFGIEVAEGFITDLATIPRWARWYVNPADPVTATAAVVHDYLYHTRQRTRLEADAVFLSLLLTAGFAPWRAIVCFAAVRLFGRSFYGGE